MKTLSLLFWLSASYAIGASTSTVKMIDGFSRAMTVQQGETPWKEGEVLCVLREEIEIACGEVKFATEDEAQVELAFEKEAVIAGDEVRKERKEKPAKKKKVLTPNRMGNREAASTSEEKSEEKIEEASLETELLEETKPARAAASDKPDNRTDADWKRIEMVQYHRNEIYKAAVVSGASMRSKLSSKPSRGPLIAGGALVMGENAANSLWPYVNVQFPTSRQYAMGVYGVVQQVGITAVKATQFGGGVTVSFFPMDTFVGVTGTIGLGLASASYTASSGPTGSSLSLMAFVSTGWRWELKEDGVTVGLQAGAQYSRIPFDLSSGGSTVRGSANILVPVFFFELGFTL